VFSISLLARFSVGLGIIAAAGCAGLKGNAPASAQPVIFYTVTAEMALARHEPRVAALQYAVAAELEPGYLPRTVTVAEQGLQPDVVLRESERWFRADGNALEAQRAAGAAALSLQAIPIAAGHYDYLLAHAPDGSDAEFARIEASLRSADNIYGARQLADRLAQGLPASVASLRLQGFTALRADDPAAAARSFAAALAQPGATDSNGELTQAWRRARVLAGEADAALAESLAQLKSNDTAANRFDYSLLLWSARRDELARVQLEQLAKEAPSRPDALRVLGLVAYQAGDDAAAATKFTELLTTGAYLDDAFYYLGLIAERHDDLERALRSYARVQSGENMVPALLRAASILYRHGAQAQADDLLDRLLDDEAGRTPEIVAARADIYGLAGRAELALTLLQEALLQYPYSVDLHYALATAYERDGQVDAALKELQDFLKERPDDPGAMNALGYTLADHSRHLHRARALIEQAYAAAPKSAAIRDSLGWVLYRQGRTAEALPLLAGAFADEPGGDIGAHLGEVLWRLDRRAEAERVWTEARRIDSDSRLVQTTRKRLHEEERAGS
jgi:Flp pilus assembly protein TadD